jgi:putative endonuclease
MMPKSHVYFMTNKNNSVIYIGVTSNLKQRIHQHKTKVFAGFSSKYNCDKLVYLEEFDSITNAIEREKQLKNGNRNKKESLIYSNNPNWKDLSEGWIFDDSSL